MYEERTLCLSLIKKLITLTNIKTLTVSFREVNNLKLPLVPEDFNFLS